MLENLLKICGLNPTEQRVFLNLASQGESLASLIAKRIKLKRTTVYAALDSLVHYGIVSRRRRENATYFAALEADTVAKILENRAKEGFEEVYRATQLLKLQLKTVQPRHQNLGIFEVSTVESVAAVYTQLEEAIQSGDFQAFFNPQIALRTPTFKNLVTKFLNNTAKTKANIREILVPGPAADWYKSFIKNPHHKVKALGTEDALLSDIILSNGYIIINSYDPKQEVGLKIREPHLYQSLIALFDWMWERL